MGVDDKRAVVIGAGIVGVCTALQLLSDGWRVTLIEREEPGAGASKGNAGIIALSHVIPLGTPKLLAKAPFLLLDRSSPISLRWGYLP